MPTTLRIISITLSLWLVLPLNGLSSDADSVEDAARRFRMQSFKSFRSDRPELDRRLKAAEQILDGWRAGRYSSHEIPGLIRWFDQATEMSRQVRRGPLPVYSLQPAPAEIDVRSATNGATSGENADSLDYRPQGVGYHDRPTRRTVPRREARRPGNHQGAQDTRQPRRERPDNLAPMGVEAFVPERPVAALSPGDDRFPTIRLQKASPDTISLTRQPASPVRAASMDSHHHDPQLVNVSALPQVDYDILAAKIRSVNLSLAAIESELVERPATDVDGLEAVVMDLTRFIDAADLMEIYYDAIPIEQRELIESVSDPKPVQALLAQRVFEARIRLTDETERDSLYSIDDRLERLERISREMKRWIRSQVE